MSMVTAIVTHDVPGVAVILNIHPVSVTELLRSGRLPGARVGRAWVVRDEDLRDYLAAVVAEQTSSRRAQSAFADPIEKKIPGSRRRYGVRLRLSDLE